MEAGGNGDASRRSCPSDAEESPSSSGREDPWRRVQELGTWVLPTDLRRLCGLLYEKSLSTVLRGAFGAGKCQHMNEEPTLTWKVETFPGTPTAAEASRLTADRRSPATPVQYRTLLRITHRNHDVVHRQLINEFVRWLWLFGAEPNCFELVHLDTKEVFIQVEEEGLDISLTVKIWVLFTNDHVTASRDRNITFYNPTEEDLHWNTPDIKQCGREIGILDFID